MEEICTVPIFFALYFMERILIIFFFETKNRFLHLFQGDDAH